MGVSYMTPGLVVRRTKRKDAFTRYECTQCDVVLCPTDCFKGFHTLQNFCERVSVLQHLKNTTSRIVYEKLTL